MPSRYLCPAGCGKPVIRALTEARRWQLLDVRPEQAGNVAAWQDATGTWHARTLTGNQQPAPPEHKYMPHAATCAKRQPQPEPQPLQGVTFLAAWRQARSARAKAQRNQRGRRA